MQLNVQRVVARKSWGGWEGREAAQAEESWAESGRREGVLGKRTSWPAGGVLETQQACNLVMAERSPSNPLLVCPLAGGFRHAPPRRAH